MSFLSIRDFQLAGLGASTLEEARAEQQVACVDPASSDCAAATEVLGVWEKEFASAGASTSSPPASAIQPTKSRSISEIMADLDAFLGPVKPRVVEKVVEKIVEVPGEVPPPEPPVIVKTGFGIGAVVAALAVGALLFGKSGKTRKP